jgi:hypothetical protein
MAQDDGEEFREAGEDVLIGHHPIIRQTATLQRKRCGCSRGCACIATSARVSRKRPRS